MGTILVIKLITNTTFRFVYPFLPAISRGLGIGIERAGVLVSARWGASLVTPALLSVLRPNVGARRMLILGMAGFSLGAVLTVTTGLFVGALVGFVVVGLTKPFVDIAGQQHIAERTPYSVRARYIGILEMSWAGGLLIGGPVAGWLIERGDWRTPFFVFASLGVIGVGAAMAFLPRTGAITSPGPVGHAVVGRRILRFLAGIVLIGFAHESILVVLGSWLEDDFGLTLLALGGVGTLLGLSDLAGEGLMIGLTDRLGKRRAIVTGSVIALAGLAVLASAGSFVASMVGLAVTMIGTEFAYISGIPLATEIRPDDRTRVLGWFYLSTGLGRIAGDLVAPTVFTAAGMTAVSVTAMLAFGGAIVAIRSGADAPTSS